MKTLLHLLILGLLIGLTPTYSATVTGRSAKTTLDGTEELPINDGGVDKKVSVSNLLLTPQGAMTATSINGLTIDTTTGTLDVVNGKTLAVSNSLTLAGTDGDTVTFPAGGGTIVTLDATQTLLNKTLTAPTLTAPTLGVATATSINGLTIDTSSGTLDIANSKTLAASNSLTLAGTDGTTMTFPGTSGAVITADSTSTLTNKTLTAPIMTTPTLGVASATSINKVAITAPASGATLTLTDGKTLAVTHSLTLAGTDSTTMTFPGTSQTLVGLTATQTLTNKTLTAPTLTAPVLGVATATSVNGLIIDTTTGTLDLTNGKTLAVSNSLTLAGTDGTTMTFPATTATVFTSTLASNDVGAANGLWGASNALVLEGATADTSETSIVPADPTADRTVTLADASGTVMLSSLATNAPDAANSVTGASNALVLEGATADAHETSIVPADPTADRTVTLANASGTVMLSSLATNAPDAANSVTGASNGLVYEGATADAFETTVTVTDPTADRTVTLPNASGTAQLSQASTEVSLTADNQAVTPGAASVIQLTSDNATATNRTFTLSATGAITGQVYYLIGPASNQCEIADTGIQVLSATWSPTTGDTLTLLFDGTNFVELARANN